MDIKVGAMYRRREDSWKTHVAIVTKVEGSSIGKVISYTYLTDPSIAAAFQNYSSIYYRYEDGFKLIFELCNNQLLNPVKLK